MEEATRPEPIFADGMSFKLPHPNSPEFIKGKISIKTDNFIKFLEEHQKEGWITLDMKKSKKGTIYFQLDTWQPKGKDEISAKELGKGDKSDEINLAGF